MGISPAALGEVMGAFEENFRQGLELGAGLSVWWRGEEVLGLAEGWCEKEKSRRWTENTLAPIYSATKGPAAASLLMALERHGLGAETPVSEVWPRFPLPEATFADLLSHQCGLAALDREADLFDHESVVAAIEAQAPRWRPGEGHGYHPRTFGALVEEPVRRLTGKALGRFWWEEMAGPLGLDLWIGLPESEWSRVARLYPGRTTPEDLKSGFYREFNREESLTRQAFGSPRGLRSVQEMNSPAVWKAGLPGQGGVASARGLAKFYQAAIGAIESPLSDAVRRQLRTRRVDGEDCVLLQRTAFAAGCQLDPRDEAGRKLRHLYGPHDEAFGHPGAGGSHAFGDPVDGISFGYVMNQMELSVLPGRRCERLVEALYA